MSDEQLSEFERRLAAKEKELGLAAPAKPAPAFDHTGLIPEIDLSTSPEDDALDIAIKNMSIVDAYNKWCGKSKPQRYTGQKEGIKISCPNPAHPDTDPSAWLNDEKGLWTCGGCAIGGDLWDFAAWHFGYSVPGYKRSEGKFRELREKMGADLGFHVVRGVTGTFIVEPGDDDTGSGSSHGDEASELSNTVEEAAPDNVRVLPSAVEREQQEESANEKAQENSAAVVDWRGILPENTFLHKYMEATSIDDCPEEYHFWMGLMALGFAVGRHRVLLDFKPVVPNLFVCLVGPSGSKKSQAKGYLSDLIEKVMPYNYNDVLNTGVKDVKSPGSAEYVVKTFSAPMQDPIDPKKISGYAPVRALIQFDELSTLMSMSSRAGSTMVPQLLELYDSAIVIGSGSLTHGERIAKFPFGQVVSSTQNDSITTLLSKKDDSSGFMNRWVFASGKLKPERSLGGEMVDLNAAAEYLKGIRAWSGAARSLQMTEEAYTRWNDFFHSVIVPAKKKTESNGTAILTRTDLLMKKLFLLFACNMRTEEITIEAVEQAIKMWPYLLATYGVVNKEMGRTADKDLTDKIIDSIRKFVKSNSRGPSGSDLYRVLRNHGSLNGIQRQLLDMSRMGMISEAPPPDRTGKGGRPPATRWLVNEAS